MKRHSIKVTARSQYEPEQSSPEDGRYVFSYIIQIENQGTLAAQLLDRHWIITDADGQIQEVRGKGVVGQQPYLKPGESFEYRSGAVLTTPIGSMHGSYGMRDDEGTSFDTPIPAFALQSLARVH